MLAILNFLNAHNLPIFQPILMILVSKFMVHKALSDKTYLSLGLMSPLMCMPGISISNKKGPNSFSAVFMKLNLPNDDLK